MNGTKFYYCTVCGNIIEKVHDSGLIPTCCMREMEELEAGAVEASTEHHIPMCEKNGKKVDICVGQKPHPMEKDHYIEWIEVVTDKGVYRRHLSPGDEAKAHFHLLGNENILCVYAYCNKHKLWQGKCEETEYNRYTDD